MQQVKPALNRKFLEDKLLGTEIANYHREILDYPEKVIQFGEGNFLRAFVEWMFHNMNKQVVLWFVRICSQQASCFLG